MAHIIPIKPPLGITPRWLLAEQRAWEIVNAMVRYQQADMPIDKEWSNELAEILRMFPNALYIGIDQG